ncbi:MAG: potassium channel family protein [Candidatus Accumulibacter propinquus]|jgi:hypothetical protein
MNASVFFLALRRMRAPLIVLIVIYAVSTLGLTLIPGVDAQGRPAPPMSFFHAFYFVSYTASTIGFGELPGAFSEAQRMWVTVVIFLSVIGWSYSIISLLSLVQDKGFQQVLLTGASCAGQATRRTLLHPLRLWRDRFADRARARPRWPPGGGHRAQRSAYPGTRTRGFRRRRLSCCAPMRRNRSSC